MPDDAVNRIDEHAETLSRHGQRLNQHDTRMNQHDTRITSVEQTLQGDPARRYVGALERIELLEKFAELLERRWDSIVVATRVALALLSLTGLGVWAPYLRMLLELMGE